MCGFAGFLAASSTLTASEASAVLSKMSDAIIHRGPDDGGLWFEQGGIGFAHRRLSILDLSPSGRQPMVSPSGRYVMAYNGEIYNHVDLRVRLERDGYSQGWCGHSDTETLLSAIDTWGIQVALEHSVGMFSFALWDKQERTLTLGRDRLGEKPLYYGWQGFGEKAAFVFGSELAALRKHPSFMGEMNRDSLCLLMRYNYIPAPHSIYRGIYKLPPGFLLNVSLTAREPILTSYWSLTKAAIVGSGSLFKDSSDEVVDELEKLLKSSVRQQMVADVPLGAFLSGGIDSSIIVALMQAQSMRPVKTFTIGFKENRYNEAEHAKAVAKHLGTDHTEIYVTPKQALEVIPNLPLVYSEPFADSSQIPMVLVSQLAREKVSVSLSGDAGDELFAGYNRYVLTKKLWASLSHVPARMRSLAASAITALPAPMWSSLLDPLQSIFPNSLRHAHIGDKLHKGAGVLAAANIDDLYFCLLSNWNPDGLIIDGKEPQTLLNRGAATLYGLDGIQRMMLADTAVYLPDDILTKVDRATMSVSLEGRIPFLDHRVVEFAWRVPESMKLQGGVGKWILRQVLYRYLPRELVERPKMGFGVPIDSWLRGPLRDWAEDLLEESRLRREGFFNASLVRKKWKEHLSGQRNWHHHLWGVLMFQLWLERAH